MSKFFDELMESVQQMNEIISVEREPSREFYIDESPVKKKPGSIRCLCGSDQQILPSPHA